MKRITYIIMILYYVLMGIDLWIGWLMPVNIFSPSYTILAMLSIHGHIHGAVVIGGFVVIIGGLILFTTLSHFKNGKYKILSTIILILVALGNFSVVFDFPTVLICIILIVLTFYISKKDKDIIVRDDDLGVPS